MALLIEPNVGKRLRQLRERRRLSLRDLAEKCGLSFNAISRIERGENSPTVSTLHSLATALNVPITDFFEDSHEEATVLIRKDRRLRSDVNGVSMESLGVGLRGQQLEPFLVTVEAGAGNADDPISHGGEEFVHCLEGTISYQVNHEIYHLEAGDSLLFEAAQPHCFQNPGQCAARLLIVFQAVDGKLQAGHHHLHM
ncbi:MAG: helix-turn-helix transcriptional regulator [Anaerolineaceae bacterium]|nr:helix-turn-helix transcriptional regulator [Anaerolineaceae bacterium]